MTMEEALAVVQKIADAWAAFGQSMTEVAQALEDMFRDLGNSDELWPKRNGLPPKKVWHSPAKTVPKECLLLPLHPSYPSKSSVPEADISIKRHEKRGWSAWFGRLSGYLRIEFQPLEPSTCY